MSALFELSDAFEPAANVSFPPFAVGLPARVARPARMTATLRHPATRSVMHGLPRAQIYASWDDDWR